MSSDILYYIGLCLVVLYVSTGFDDFVWDVVTLLTRKKHNSKRLKPEDLDSKPPKLIALVIAAWHEDNVLTDVIDNIIASQQYPRSMYHIFLGVYPNDGATISVAESLDVKYTNVHCVINNKLGPTSKAQNINHVIRRIKQYEQERGWRFATVTIHDSEDLVHPYEFKITNYLVDTHPALQFPVFPLIRKPTFGNFFANITTNTYADEFAENHFITMVSRFASGAFVPSAGTGFSLSRDTIDSLGEQVLPENSLTEDYRLSLTLYERGLQMYYVLERVMRVNAEGNLSWDYVATRSMFPNTFKTAVRQKTRWTLGITMQSFRLRDIFKGSIPFSGRYSLYRDQKAKIGNLLSCVGYPVVIYFLASLFLPLIPIYPKYSLSWYLSLVVTVMMLERQSFRAIALYNIYGLRSAFFGCLFPPLLPIRTVWGNIINMVSTYKAYIQYFGGSLKENTSRAEALRAEEYNSNRDIQKENEDLLAAERLNTKAEIDLQEKAGLKGVPEDGPQEKAFVWAKTDHSFLEKPVLLGFHRKMGDVLIEKGILEARQVKRFLHQKNAEEPMGLYLLQNGYITECQLIEALATIKHVQCLREESLPYYDLQRFASIFDQNLLMECHAFPILETCDGYVFAYSESSPADAQSILRSKLNCSLRTVLTTDAVIQKGLESIWSHESTNKGPNRLTYLYDQGCIDPEQVVIAKNWASQIGLEDSAVLSILGLDAV